MRSAPAMAVLALVALAAPAGAQDLTKLTLEDLLAIEVTSVSHKEETLLRTAAAVYVITEHDIRRSGAATLPDLFRMVPGFAVGQLNANTWSVTARGFAGTKANKLLVLIDGRSLYTPLNGGVFWDMQLLPLASIARIEVIRGPGAAVWGTNAVNGVINIITKDADAMQGASITVHTGRSQPGAIDFGYGGTLGAHGHHATSGRVLQRRSPGLTAGRPHGDDVDAFVALTRLDWTTGDNRLSVQADVERGSGERVERLVQLVPPYESGVPAHVNFAAGNAVVTWARGAAEDATSVQVSYSGVRRSDLREEAHTVDVDARKRRAFGRHDVVVGAGFRSIADRITPSSTISIAPPHMHRQFVAAFVHDEVALGPRLNVTSGAKVERNPFTGLEVQPSVRALWAATAGQSVWGAVSRTVRIPNRYERGMSVISAVRPGPGVPTVVTLDGSDLTSSEILTGYEAGYRVRGRRFSVDTTGFVGSYADLTSQLALPAEMTVLRDVQVLRVPLVKRNDASATAGGAETAVRWQPVAWWDVTGSYSLFHIGYAASGNGGSAQIVPINGPVPRHSFHARTGIDLPRDVEASALFYRTSTIPAIGIEAINRLDLHVGWAMGRGVRVAAGVQNLLHGTRFEYLDQTSRVVATTPGTSPWMEVSWRF